LFGTALAAERAGVPAIALVHSPYPLRTGDGPGDDFFAPGLAKMNEARAQLGLDPVHHWDQQLLNTRAVCVLTVPELDPAGAFELPPNVRFVGPVFEPDVSPWTSPWPAANTDPLVVISFSTTFMDQHDLAQRVLHAVADLPVRALFTAGPAIDVEGFDVPANARVSAFVPHGAVMPHAALAITHAGFGTVQAALAAGTPMVCIPCGRDQPGNAAHVAGLGAGLTIAPTASTGELRAVIEGALADPQLEMNAERVSVLLGRADGGAVVVREIEAVSR
jgi:MGT family glycosyltransferase